MKAAIAEKIRAFRKSRNMTQEALAEALNVSVGVISKWELGLSEPELGLVLELAAFFETSVDVLVGYQKENQSRERFLEEVKGYIHDKTRPVSFVRIEKERKKYPNDFDVAYRCAVLYEVKSVEYGNRNHCLQALALYEEAAALMAQNTDADISITDLRRYMAQIHRSLGNTEEALALLKANNPCGVNNALMGEILGQEGRPEEALPYLSKAMLNSIRDQMDIAAGLMNAFWHQHRYRDVVEVADWIEAVVTAAQRPGIVGCNDKFLSAFQAIKAHGWLRLGDRETAKICLAQAGTKALRFDDAPNYSANVLRFAQVEAATAYDDYGATALEGIGNLIAKQEDGALSELWQEVCLEKEKAGKAAR